VAPNIHRAQCPDPNPNVKELLIHECKETLQSTVITSLNEWLADGVQSKVVVERNAEVSARLRHRRVLHVHRQHERRPETCYLYNQLPVQPVTCTSTYQYSECSL